MSDIVGIIPSAGRASRIGGFFKELTPINVNPSNSAKFIVVSERIVWQMSHAGAAPLYFVVSSDKSSIISDYYGRSNLFPNKRLFFKVQGNLDKLYGMPFAIDSVYEDARGKTVVLGMPDTLIEPDEAFTTLLTQFKQHGSDLELGLFATRPDNYGGYVTFDRDSARVTAHVDKASPSFVAEQAENAWAIACWNGNFTEFLHEFVQGRQLQYANGKIKSNVELLFGDIVDAAIQDRALKVCASFISEDSGYYLDITDPAKYFQAVLHYHKPPLGAVLTKSDSPLARARRKSRVFISHSAEQKSRADDLHALLESNGYEQSSTATRYVEDSSFPSEYASLLPAQSSLCFYFPVQALRRNGLSLRSPSRQLTVC